MAYKEVSATSGGNTKKFDHKGQVVEGTLVEMQTGIGVNKSNVYSIATKDGIEKYWGANALDNLMANVKIGKKIRITCTDDKFTFPNKNVGKNFKVEIDE